MDADQDELLELVRGCSWSTSALEAAREVDAAQWWIGGGVLRDLVCDGRASGVDPARSTMSTWPSSMLAT